MKRLLILLLCLLSQQLLASHLLGGYVSYRWVNGNQYEVTVTLLTDDDSGVAAGDGVLNFGDNTFQKGGFETTIEKRSNAVNVVTFSVLHDYSGFGSYEIFYSEPNYNFGINNIENSGNTPFFITATVQVTDQVRGNSSPVLQLLSNQKGISRVKQKINPAAFDTDGDSLSYELIVPKQGQNQSISGYLYPNDAAFYSSHNTGNQANDGEPTYSINPVSGEVFWDAPELLGEYAIAYKVTQWRKIFGIQTKIGDSEIVLINRIVDDLNTVLIDSPDPQCYDQLSDVQAQFIINGPVEENLVVQVFSDFEGGLINDIPIRTDEILNFILEGTLALSFTIPSGIAFNPLKPYRVIITVETSSETVTTSWVFAIGCESLPDNISPDPIVLDAVCEELEVYPNPSFGENIKICVPNGSDEPKYLRIVDLAGRVLLDQRILPTSSVLELETNGYKPGLYILQVDKTTVKFVIDR